MSTPLFLRVLRDARPLLVQSIPVVHLNGRLDLIDWLQEHRGQPP
jgi:hypothetical protein